MQIDGLERLRKDFSLCYEKGMTGISEAQANEPELSLMVFNNAERYQSIVWGWLADGPDKVMSHLRAAIDYLNQDCPSQAIPSAHFIYAVLTAQLLGKNTPPDLLDALLDLKQDEKAWDGITWCAHAFTSTLHDTARKSLMRNQFKNLGLDTGKTRSLFELKFMTDEHWIAHAIEHDNVIALQIVIGGGGEIQKRQWDILTPLWSQPSGACPELRRYLFGQVEPIDRELMFRLTQLWERRNTDDLVHDFDMTLPPGFLNRYANDIQYLFSMFFSATRCFDDRLIQSFRAFDQAGYDWHALIGGFAPLSHRFPTHRAAYATKEGILNPNNAQGLLYVPEDPEVRAIDTLRMCLLCDRYNTNLKAVFSALVTPARLKALAEAIKGDDALVLKAYEFTGKPFLLGYVENKHELSDVLSTDLGL